MSSPTVTPTQDDLMTRLQSVASPSAQGQNGSFGDDLMTRLNAVAGTTPVTMVGPNGQTKTFASKDVSDARKQNYAVAPDNPGVTKMVSPSGRLTYALPSELDNFKQGGHTVINPDGSFRIDPLPGEDNIDTMDRARRVMKSLSYEDQVKAMKAEIQPYDPRPVSSGGSGLKGAARLAIHGVVAPAAAATITGGALAGGSEVLGGLQAAGSALAETEAGQLFSSSPRLYAEYLMKKGLKGVSQYALEHKLGTAIVLDQLAKVLGIQKQTVLHKLISAGAGAMTE